MGLSPKEILQRLGPDALARTLDDIVDQPQLVRLANACGVKYPGQRTQTQTRERLLADLVGRVEKDDNAGKAVVRALGKATADAGREWAGLDDAERARRLGDEGFLAAAGQVGVHLFLLASTNAGFEESAAQTARTRLLALGANGSGPRPARKAAREETRLRRQLEQRQKKIRHLEGQLARSHEAHKAAKSDLIQRKGELAESRMLAERLRGELTQARAAAQLAAAARPAAPDANRTIADLSKVVRRLAAEQKKLTHLLEKDAAGPATADAAALHALAAAVRDSAAHAERQEQTLAGCARDIEALREDVRALGARTAASKPSRKKRPQGQASRVGVFIDVQNVYYAARHLKGKLDFDALLQAAVGDRRLIRATAYVVESMETDQSQFIARLHKRGIEVQRKTLHVRPDGSMKGNWDMELALDILDAAPRLDVVVLVSGDGDFTSLVKRVKGMGPRVEVIAFPRSAAKALIAAADEFRSLDRKFMIYTRGKREKEAAAQADGPATPHRKASAGKAAEEPAAEEQQASG
jgi:uncharacterized LabA/DUF88 family protein